MRIMTLMEIIESGMRTVMLMTKAGQGLRAILTLVMNYRYPFKGCFTAAKAI